MKQVIVIITGANSGIGKAAAERFAKEGYQVIMACRNMEKGRKAHDEIRRSTKSTTVDLLEVDMSSFRSIRSFCEIVEKRYDAVDILIHNAAYFNHSEKIYQVNDQGIELSFATNTLGPYFMSQLFRNKMRRSSDPRILNACTTNIKHFFDPKRTIDIEGLTGPVPSKKKYNAYKKYGDSKMALLMLTFKMAEEFKMNNIKVNAVQIPAVKLSKEAKQNLKSLWRVAAEVQTFFALETEEMANIYYDLCTSDRFSKITGCYINHKTDLMKPTGYKPSLKTQIKQFFGYSLFPVYAIDPNRLEKVWEVINHMIEHAKEEKSL
ncbi:short-chain dehydrogenase [Salipaludibacillus keqinensis]|uniref:Short-chain dehydrogenase n=1 Tax=Salipaludibacillus keqinensis TaxID=2045207 RepID=A0A323TM06_9BACI|nr:SDR family NAD(P)-dependent oxidoreductase [Salipaludibacillus keqinensis]PYZ95054.1 short-chain dehydrogenase [Salipaludibacillus keqinensis]